MSLAGFLDWMQSRALPKWLAAGRDPTTGLFFERLQLNGAPDRAAVLRTRSQFRQLYVWSHAAALGLIDRDRGVSEAMQSAEALRAALWLPNRGRGWSRAMSLDGATVDPTIDLYDHACVLLGLAWLAEVSGDERYLDWIDETMAAIETVLAAPTAGWAEDDGGSLPRRQNPHMHQLEAFLALAETTGENRFSVLADAMVDLFNVHLFDAPTGTLREYFGPNWEVDAHWQSEDRLEPGHHCEWVWLLRRYARLRPDVGVDAACEALLGRAEAIGTLPLGLLALEVNTQGAPRQPTQRLWAQAEFMKALIVQGDLARAGDIFATVKRYHLDPAPDGTWIDALTLAGEPMASHIPSSSLYHLFTAVPEIQRALL